VETVPPPEPEPVAAPIVKEAAPAPIVDSPKDRSAPGTRYIGFGQANIKVKWGADAPPSAPRGHDKYDRWSMAHNPGAPPPAAEAPMSPTSTTSLNVAEAPASPTASSSSSAPRVGCCAMLFPCLFSRQQKQAENREKLNDASWQSSSSPSAASHNDTTPAPVSPSASKPIEY